MGTDVTDVSAAGAGLEAVEGRLAALAPIASTWDWNAAVEGLLLGLADTFAGALEPVRAKRPVGAAPPGGHAALSRKVMKTYQGSGATQQSARAVDSAA